MQYQDDMINLFIANYSASYPVEMDGLGIVDITAGVVTPSAVDSKLPWLRLSFTSAATENATIGTVNSRLKREPFSVNIQMMIPITTFASENVFTYSVAATLERELDAFMLTDGLNATGEQGLIYSDQQQPKSKSTPPPSKDDTYRVVLFEYEYMYQYI